MSSSLLYRIISIVLLSLSSYTNGLLCGDTATGSTISNSTISYYKITINEKTNNGLYVTIDSCQSKYDTWLYLYDNFGSELESCDDCGDCGFRTVLKPNILYNGNYTLGIGGFSNSYGKYSVKILCDSISHPYEQGPYNDNWWSSTTTTTYPSTTNIS